MNITLTAAGLIGSTRYVTECFPLNCELVKCATIGKTAELGLTKRESYVQIKFR